MASIILKRVTRHADCGHLIPEGMAGCPYCAGKVTRHAPQEEASPQRGMSRPDFKIPELSPEMRKRLGIAAAAVVLLIAGFWGWQTFAKSKVLEKPISEELSPSMVEELCKENSDFYSFYADASALREFTASLPDKQHFEDITYQRLKDYLANCYSNDIYCEELGKSARNKYIDEMYKPLESRINELKTKWETYIKEHDVNQFVEITPETDYYVSSSYYYSEYYPAFWFHTKFDSSKVKDFQAKYGVEGDELAGPFDMESIMGVDSRDNLRYYNNRGSYSRSYWDNHTMCVEIVSVTLADGTVISASDMDEVPEEVKNYFANPCPETECSMIKVQIDENFLSEDEFATFKVNERLKEKDNLCYELLERYNASDNSGYINKSRYAQ